MKKAGLFQKVSKEQFYCDFSKVFGTVADQKLERVYNGIGFPERRGPDSVAYSFYAPFPTVLIPGKTLEFPTGINVVLRDDWFLAHFIPPALSEHGVCFAREFGMINGSYRFSENEGHIILSMTLSESATGPLKLKAGDEICRGVLISFGTAFDDCG